MGKYKNNDILVSVCCITYNHEKYISKTIDSFLMQKTDFKFEILIHDDASTDNTANIISKYQKKYPEIINPIYQSENHYSKGIKIFPITYSKAVGKYIAQCEGDDYWTDELKLQKQVNCMQSHPEYSLCIHATQRINLNNQVYSPIQAYKESKTFGLEEMLYRKDTMFHTSSMMFQSRLVQKLPKYYNNAPVGDAPLKIHLMTLGNVFYINEFMSAYRSNVPGSWSNRVLGNSNKAIEHCNAICKMLNEINNFTEYKYKDAIKYRIMLSEASCILKMGNYKKIVNKKYKPYRKLLSIKDRVSIYIKALFPKVYDAYISFMRKQQI